MARDAKAALLLDGIRLGQQGRPAGGGSVSEHFSAGLCRRAFVDERIDRVADRHAPAGGPVRARDFLRGLEQIHARAAEPAIRLRQTDRAQIGLHQGCRDSVREPAQPFRSERFLTDQAADRLGATERAVVEEGDLASLRDGRRAAEIIHELSPSIADSLRYFPGRMAQRSSLQRFWAA